MESCFGGKGEEDDEREEKGDVIASVIRAKRLVVVGVLWEAMAAASRRGAEKDCKRVHQV